MQMKKPDLVMRAIERLILAYPRRLMRKNARKKLAATTPALDECIKTRSKLAQHNVPDLLRLLDASQFCLMYQADIIVLIRDTTCQPNWWERRLYGRLLAMTMLECVEDIPAVLNKDFRPSLITLGIQHSSQQRLLVVTKGLAAFRKSHESILRPIRSVAAAHRDQNAAVQAKVIEELDIRQLMQMATELTNLLNAFVQVMSDVLSEVHIFAEVIKSFATNPA